MKTKTLVNKAIRILRRALQASMVVLILALSFLSLYAHYHAASGLEELDEIPGVKGGVLREARAAIGGMENPETFLDGFKGTLWSMRLAGLDISDPLAAAEMFAASRTIYVPMLLSILIPLLFTLVLGKVFCSFLCPGYLVFELGGKLRKLLRIAELNPASVRFSPNNKYLILVLGLAFASVAQLPLFALVYPPALLSRMAHAWVFGTALTGMALIMALILAFELFVSPRWWCRTICPGGALYGLLGWPRLLRVSLDERLCSACNKCITVCEQGLKPTVESSGIECDNCSACIQRCPEGALAYAWRLPAGGGRKSRGDGRTPHAPGNDEAPRQSTSARGRTVATLTLALCIGLPCASQAHHILGLPHYSYKENYPQAPTLEYPAQTGPYDVLLTSYPGRPVPAEPTNLVFYIKNRETGKPYEQTIAVRILQSFTLRPSVELMPRQEVPLFEQPHKLTFTFPRDGEFIAELTLDVDGRQEVIPFRIVAGDASPTRALMIVGAFALVVAGVVVRAVRIKRKRRARHTRDRPTGQRPCETITGKG